MSMIVAELCSEYWFPADGEAERRLIGALFVAKPDERKHLVRSTREAWFFDDWHRDVFRSISKYRDFDGEELLRRVLTRQHREKWSGCAAYVSRLFVNDSGESVCGKLGSWRRYVSDLKRVYDRRVRLITAACQLEDAIHECRDSVFVA